MIKLEIEFESIDDARDWADSLREYRHFDERPNDSAELMADKIDEAIEGLNSSMTMNGFRNWIIECYNIPYDNNTLAPDMFEGILNHAENMKPDEQCAFLCDMFPSIPKSIIQSIKRKENNNAST